MNFIEAFKSACEGKLVRRLTKTREVKMQLSAKELAGISLYDSYMFRLEIANDSILADDWTVIDE